MSAALSAEDMPWLNPAIRQLTALAAAQRLAHALLISGLPGTGKGALSHALSTFLLCKMPKGHQACGQCKSCLLVAAGNHPDLLVLGTEQTSIGVEEIRSLIAFTQGTAQQSGARVIVLPQIERLTDAAANALLKTLEEPPHNCFMLLQTSQPQQLKPTLLSRCQQWSLAGLSEQALGEWLQRYTAEEIPSFLHQYSAGAPLAALALLQSAALPQITALLTQLNHYMAGQTELTEMVRGLESRSDSRQILGYFINSVLLRDPALSAERKQRAVQRYMAWCRDEQQILGQNKALALFALLSEVKLLVPQRER